MKNQVRELNLGSIDKFGVFGNRIEFFQPNCARSGVKLKTIKSLMVNRGSNCMNPKARTKVERACKFKVAI